MSKSLLNLKISDKIYQPTLSYRKVSHLQCLISRLENCSLNKYKKQNKKNTKACKIRKIILLADIFAAPECLILINTLNFYFKKYTLVYK